MKLKYDKYDDFLRPVEKWMHEEGEVVEPQLFTEKYMQSLSPEELRDHANKLYTMIGPDILGGSTVPQSDSQLIAWILQVQSRVFHYTQKPPSHGPKMVHFHGTMIVSHEESTLRSMPPSELRQYAMVLFSTISRVGMPITPVPHDDGSLVSWILQVQKQYLQPAAHSVVQPAVATLPTAVQTVHPVGTIGTIGTIGTMGTISTSSRGMPSVTGAPATMTYGAPSTMTYGAPATITAAPSTMTYGAPATMTYGAPATMTYAAPTMTYGAPGATMYQSAAAEPVSAFDQIDTNHDGVISRAEFASMMR
jgi:hypothetical protein